MNELIRKSTFMTPRGLAVLLPPTIIDATDQPPASLQCEGLDDGSSSDDEEEGRTRDGAGAGQGSVEREKQTRSPIAQMLYSRWLLSLKEQRTSILPTSWSTRADRAQWGFEWRGTLMEVGRTVAVLLIVHFRMHPVTPARRNCNNHSSFSISARAHVPMGLMSE